MSVLGIILWHLIDPNGPLLKTLLEGQDNAQILKALYDELATIDLKKYASIDESIFAELEKLKTESMSGDPLRFNVLGGMA